MKKKFLTKFIHTILILICFAHFTSAQIQASYDQSFGGSNPPGAINFSLGSTSETSACSAIDPSNGLIYIIANTDQDNDETYSSRGILLRYKPDGSPDASFSTVYIDSPNGADYFQGIVLDASGKIIVIGSSKSYPTIWRFTQNGNLDTGFGTGGQKSLTEVGGFRNVAIQPNGMIVASGYGFTGSNPKFAYLAARFTQSGQLDINFNGIGYIEYRTSTSSYEEDEGAGWGIAIQPNDQKIVICGYTTSFSDGDNASAIRLNTNGTIDNTFNNYGSWTSFFSKDDYFWNVKALNESGNTRLVFCGQQKNTNSNNYLLMVRLNNNGSFDNSFNQYGLWLYDYPGNGFDYIRDFSILSDGSYLIAGQTNNKANLSHISKSGAFDADFGFSGLLPFPIGGGGAYTHIEMVNNCVYLLGNYYSSLSIFDDEVFMTKTCLQGITTTFESTVSNTIVYPNPAQNVITLQFDIQEPVTGVIQFFNMDGRQIENDYLNVFSEGRNEVKLDVSTWNEGYYVFRILTEKGSSAGRIFVKR